jgi:CYTH domain-containing protein
MREQPPTGSRIEWLDTNLEKKEVVLADEPLLLSVFKGNANAVKSQEERERRYRVKRKPAPAELARLANRVREIKQTYVNAKDEKGKEHSFRLRWTFEEGEGNEGATLRVVYKDKIPSAEALARTERQVDFSLNDPRAKDFYRLWGQSNEGWEDIRKTRYYIPYQLSNGSSCEIHYDVHHEQLEGFSRIEVEFANDEDARIFQKDVKTDPFLKDFIGEDVTKDKQYSSKYYGEHGLPDAERKRRSSGAR